MTITTRLCVVVCLLAVAGPAAAQSATDSNGYESARFRVGPLRLTPSIALSDIGVDSNVFNDPVNPRSDSTLAIGPASDFWINPGPTRVKVHASVQYLYYSKYENQRSWNTGNEARWDLPLARMTPFIGGSYTNTRQRPGYEIDTRAHQKTLEYGGGTSLKLTGKSELLMFMTRTSVEFDEEEQFLGAALATALNRKTNREEAQFRQKLTPLTTFLVRFDAAQDRFDHEPLRDTNSYRVMSGFEFKPFALISGTAAVGFRRFNVLSDRVSDYNGLAADVSVKYSIARTMFDVHAARDLDFSFEQLLPYYTLTDRGVTVTQRLTRGWDVLGRVAWQSLSYKSFDVLSALPPRTDHASTYGGGVGYRIAPTLRAGLEINSYRRNAPDASIDRDFNGVRIFGSVSYGLPQ